MNSAMEKGRSSSRRGIALVGVLWLLTILSAIALEVAVFSNLRIHAARNNGDGVRALFLARAGVERAIADLTQSRDRPETLDDLRETSERIYHNVELGDGTYTLLAEPASRLPEGPDYGFSDEGAKIDLNTADQSMLARLPGMDADVAADIALLRKEKGKIHDLGDLLLIQKIDPLVLYGEDQNQNCLLDPNENDGQASWPPDNGNGVLDRGLAPFLTCYSAAKNVTKDGKSRVNINSASADDIVKEVSGITRQQADSIVEHRKKQSFSSIADLMDVKLVQKTEEQKPADKPGSQGKGQPSVSGPSAGDKGSASGKNSTGEPKLGEPVGKRPETKSQPETKTTDQNAFSMDQFKAIADLVTTKDDKVLRGVINVNTATPEVLGCMPGMDDTMTAEIVAQRREKSFESIADLLDVRGMSPDKFKQICNLISVRSDVFNVRSFGVLGRPEGESHGIYCCVWAVIDRSGDKVALLSWRELR